MESNMDWNSWKRRWHKLAEEKRNHKTQLKQEKKKQADEERKLSEIYWPRIRKVCKAFAKAINGWYEESGGVTVGDYWIFPQCRIITESSSTGEHYIEIFLKCNGIFVTKGGYTLHWGGESWNAEIGKISFHEFTEEKLAQLLEKAYKYK